MFYLVKHIFQTNNFGQKQLVVCVQHPLKQDIFKLFIIQDFCLLQHEGKVTLLLPLGYLSLSQIVPA